MIKVRRKITEFISEKYRKREPPRPQDKTFRSLDLNRTLFYKALLGGLREVCGEAGV
jgi:hypothetical protein